MKVLFFCLSLLFMSLMAGAQGNSEKQTNAPYFYEQNEHRITSEKIQGEQLLKYSRQYQLGSTMITGGYTIAALSALGSFISMYQRPNMGPGMAIGSLSVAGGLVFQLLSRKHMSKEGSSLRKNTAEQHLYIQGSQERPGIGLAYRF